MSFLSALRIGCATALFTVSAAAQDNPHAPKLIPQENWQSLELMLQTAGYPTGPADGVFDVVSSQALVAFWMESGREWPGGQNFAFTIDAYMELVELATAIQAGEVTTLRPNWVVRYWEVEEALKRIGCFGPQVAGSSSRDITADQRNRAIRCYRIHKDHEPALPILDDVDVKALIVEAANGPPVSIDSYNAAGRALNAAKTVGRPAGMPKLDFDFGAKLSGQVFTNLTPQNRGCDDPRIVILADLTTNPTRTVFEEDLYRIERIIWPNGRVCPDLSDVRIQVFAEGQEILEHTYVAIRERNGDEEANVRRRAQAATEIVAAWNAARRGEFGGTRDGISSEEFYATLRRHEVLSAIAEGRTLPEGIEFDVIVGLIHVWAMYVDTFDALCLENGYLDLSSEERIDLYVDLLLEGESGVVETSKNLRTGEKRVTDRIGMKSKFVDLYIALYKGELNTPIEGKIGPHIGDFREDVAAVIDFHSCTGLELTRFEDRLMEAALSPYDWTPPEE